MKIKGYTIVELLVTLSIIIIIFNYSAIKLSNIDKIKNNMDIEMCNNSIINIINNSKKYCRKYHNIGVIYFFKKDNSVGFYSEGVRKYYYNFPTGFEFMHINSKNSDIDIDSLGFTSDACTITYKDRKGKTHRLTMSVGTSNVEIKE